MTQPEQSKDEVLCIVSNHLSKLMNDLQYLTPHGIEMKLDKIRGQVVGGMSEDFLNSTSQFDHDVLALRGIRRVERGP